MNPVRIISDIYNSAVRTYKRVERGQTCAHFMGCPLYPPPPQPPAPLSSYTIGMWEGGRGEGVTVREGLTSRPILCRLFIGALAARGQVQPIANFCPQEVRPSSLSSPWVHCNENPIYVFFFWELHGLSPNFHIHVSVSDLCIPRIGPHIFFSCSISRPILDI